MHCAPALRALPQNTSTSDRLSKPVARIRYHVPLAPRSAATIETGPDRPEARKRAKAVSADALSLNDPNCAAKAEAEPEAGTFTGTAFGAAGAVVLAGLAAGVATLVTTGTGLGAGAGAAGFTAAVVAAGLVGVAAATSRGGGFVAGAGAGTGATAAGAALPSVNIGASAGFAG